MADFRKAYAKLEVAEGGYVFDKDDAGGETYKGVSRRANPNWIGWIILYVLKNLNPKTCSSIAKKTPQLEKAVQDLYKKNYWDCFNLDDFKSQAIAEQLFDSCVNTGKSAAIKMAQRVVNVEVDGKWSARLETILSSLR